MHNLYEKAYGRREFNAVANLTGRVSSRYLSHVSQKIDILDIGCGTMSIAGQVRDAIQRQMPSISSVSLLGWDVSKEAVRLAKEAGYVAEEKDITRQIADNRRFDLICFFEVLEHIADTDQALKNIHQLLRDDGVLVLSTPNLASWYNRLFLLFGLQPHCMELSYENPRLGNWIIRRLIPEPIGNCAGHLRLFTWHGLRDFLEYHDVRILAVKGISNHRWDFISKLIAVLFPKLSGDLFVIAQKR